MEIFESIMKIISPLLVLIITPIAIYYVNKFLKGKATQDEIDAIDRAIPIAAAAVEEEGRNRLKAGMAPMTSKEKSDEGTRKAVSELKATGVSEIAETRVKMLIEAEINATRDPSDLPKISPK